MRVPADTVDAVVSLAKRRGFVYPTGEIYGGTRSAWDYGPLGVELKENIRRAWWRSMVQLREDVVGLDSAVILSGPDVRYKLYARDVAAMPLQAELVTVSACRSAGERAYAGEGLVAHAQPCM